MIKNLFQKIKLLKQEKKTSKSKELTVGFFY